MTCAQIRVAISAYLDGEQPGLPLERLRVHLAGCAGCRSWQASAQSLTRDLVVEDGPDLVERVLAASAAERAAARGGSAARPTAGFVAGSAAGSVAGQRRAVLRVALAATALAQLVLALPSLISDLGGVAHDSREMASFDIAVAVGFLFAAWRPARAAAVLPIALALSVCLFVTGLIDIAGNAAAAAHEAGHLLVLVQAGVVWALHRAEATRRTDGQDGPLRPVIG